MPEELLVPRPREVTLAPYEDPPLAPDEVRATAVLSAISHGTELNLYRGSSPFHDKRFDPSLRLFLPAQGERAYPIRLGYEWVGRVAEVGEGVRGFEVGDPVHLPLPHRQTHTFRGEDYAELGKLEQLAPGLTAQQAALLETTGIALAALHDARVKVGDVVVIFGLGALGLLAVQLARLAGASRIVAVDPLLGRRELAEATGADEALDPSAVDVGLSVKRTGGADVAIEFSGSDRALHEAIRCVRMAGLVVAAGFYQGGASALRLGEEWHHNRVTMVSSQRGWGNPHRDAPAWDRPRLRKTAAGLLASGTLAVEGFITHRFPFERAGEAYALLDEHPAEVLKVVLTY